MTGYDSIDGALRRLGGRIAYPDPPDLAEAVLGVIQRRPPARRWRLDIAPATPVGLLIAAAVLLVVVIPSWREGITSWLGIGGIDVERVEEPIELPTGLDLGAAVDPAEIEDLAGFDPLLPSVLPEPDLAYVDAGRRVWFVYQSSDRLPETRLPGIGLIVAQLGESSVGLIKQIALDVPLEIVDVNGDVGAWVPGPHPLIFPELGDSTVDGRSAGSTLIWERGDGTTLRIEGNVTLAQALEIARSFD